MVIYMAAVVILIIMVGGDAQRTNSMKATSGSSRTSSGSF